MFRLSKKTWVLQKLTVNLPGPHLPYLQKKNLELHCWHSLNYSTPILRDTFLKKEILGQTSRISNIVHSPLTIDELKKYEGPGKSWGKEICLTLFNLKLSKLFYHEAISQEKDVYKHLMKAVPINSLKNYLVINDYVPDIAWAIRDKLVSRINVLSLSKPGVLLGRQTNKYECKSRKVLWRKLMIFLR
jgi:hypothetical protein